MRQEKAVYCPAVLIDAAAALERLAVKRDLILGGTMSAAELLRRGFDAALKERDEAREDSAHMLAMMMGERDAERAARERAEAALRKLDSMITQWARDEGFPPENSACLRVVRAALQPQPQPQGDGA